MSKLRVGGPKDFWNRIKSISVAEIAKEASRPLSVALVGDEGAAKGILEGLNRSEKTIRGQVVRPETPYVQLYKGMAESDEFPQSPDVFDFVIDVGNGRVGAPQDYPTTIYSISELGGWDQTIERIFEDRIDIMLPLARNFPIFRRKAAQVTIQQTALTNAEFSLITGVVSVFPLFELFLPANALSDIVILTKNQIMMSLRLAAIYGLEVNYKSRMKELAPILLNAFGWRSIARELVGAVPAIGFLFRAMISYAGTVTVGKTAQMYYETGESVSKSQAQRWYREAYQSSKVKIRTLADKIRFNRRGGGGGGSRLVATDAEVNTNVQPADEYDMDE